MIVFALMLIVGSLVVVGGLIVFLSENLLALVVAILAGQAALTTGGGWPGAIVAAALTFAVVSATLRLGFAVAFWPIRLICGISVSLPVGWLAFMVAETLLAPNVPAGAWRFALSLLLALVLSGTALVRQHSYWKRSPGDTIYNAGK